MRIKFLAGLAALAFGSIGAACPPVAVGASYGFNAFQVQYVGVPVATYQVAVAPQFQTYAAPAPCAQMQAPAPAAVAAPAPEPRAVVQAPAPAPMVVQAPAPVVVQTYAAPAAVFLAASPYFVGHVNTYGFNFGARFNSGFHNNFFRGNFHGNFGSGFRAAPVAAGANVNVQAAGRAKINVRVRSR